MSVLPTTQITLRQYHNNGEISAQLKNVKCLIDSGTSHSIVSRKALLHSPLTEITLPEPRFITNAVNQSTKEPVIFKEIRVNVLFQTKKESGDKRLLICEAPLEYPAIIGMDILRERQLHFSSSGVVVNKINTDIQIEDVKTDVTTDVQEVHDETQITKTRNAGSDSQEDVITFEEMKNEEKERIAIRSVISTEDEFLLPLESKYVACLTQNGSGDKTFLVRPSKRLQVRNCSVNTRHSAKRTSIKVTNGNRESFVSIEKGALLALEAPKGAEDLTTTEIAVISNFLLTRSKASVEDKQLLEEEVKQWKKQRKKLINKVSIKEDIEKKVETVPLAHQESIRRLLNKYDALFARNNNDSGLNPSYLVDLTFRPGDDGAPTFIRPYPIRDPDTRKKLGDKINELIDNNILEECSSPWNSPCLTVKKKGTTTEVRLVTNYKQLNKRLLMGNFPIPEVRILNCTISKKIADLREKFPGESIFFASLDLKNAFYCLSLTGSSRDKTAFIVNARQLRFKRLSMGLSISPVEYQRFMKMCFCGEEFDEEDFFMANYLDDFCLGSTESAHVKAIEKFFRICEENQLLLSMRKSVFFQKNTAWLGLIIDEKGFRVEKNRTEALLSMPYPRTKKEAQRFCGTFNFYIRQIPRLSLLLSPLSEAIGSTEFTLTDQAKAGIDRLKEIIKKGNGIRTCHLNYGNRNNQTIYIACDTSLVGSGFVIGNAIWKGEEIEILDVCHYGSKKLDRLSQLLSSRARELIGLQAALEAFKDLLWEGLEFVLLTDHRSLEKIGEGKTLGKTSSNTRTRNALATVLNYPNLKILYVPATEDIIQLCDGLSRSGIFSVEEVGSAELDPRLELPVALNAIEVTRISSDNLRAEQRKDAKLGEIIRKLEKLKDQRENDYSLEDGTLMKQAKNGTLLTVVPEALAKLIVNTVHIQNVHSGERRLREALMRSKFLIPGITKLIKNVVRKCLFCQMTHTSKYPRLPDPNYAIQPAVKPWQRVSIDLMDVSYADSACYLLTFLCKFSKYLEFEIIRRKSMDHVVPAMVNLITKTGCEMEANIASDRGLEFLSAALKDAYKRLNVYGHTQTAYNSRANPCERCHRELRRLLRTLMPTAKDYMYKIKIAVNYYNGMPQERLAMMSPRQILQGTPPRAYLNYLHPHEKKVPEKWSDSDAADEEAICRWADYIDDLQLEHGLREISRYNLAEQPESKFEVGALVLVTDPIIMLSKTNRPLAEGPFIIIKKRRNTLTLRHIITHNEIARNGRFVHLLNLDSDDQQALIDHERRTRENHKMELPPLITQSKPMLEIVEETPQQAEETPHAYNLRKRK